MQTSGGNKMPGVVIVLGLGVAVVFLLAMLTATEGHFVPQVVDLYLVCQYAKAMAEGHPFQYNVGEPRSTGATSLLHTALLALGHALGARGEALIAFAIVTGAACFFGSLVLAYRIGLLLGREREAKLGACLVALGGPVVWGYFYGSDTALFMLLSLWLLERLLSGWSRGAAGGVAAAGGLLSLARPEGLPIAAILGVAWSLGPGRSARGWRRWLIWLPLAAGLLVLTLNRTLTGRWLGTSISDKGLLANYGTVEGLGLVTQYLVDVLRGLLLGFYPADAAVGFSKGLAPLYFPPLALIAILLAAARPLETTKTPLRLWLGTVAVLFVLVSPNVFLGVHFNRYLMWAFPTLLVVAAVGLGTATRAVAREDILLETALFKAGAGLALALALLSTLRFATFYADMAGQVYRKDVAAARWIVEHIPAGARMANVATSVEYLTGHHNLNLHGVASPAFFGNRLAEREAGVFEALTRLPAAERPSYLITSVSTQDANPSLRELLELPVLYQTTSFEDEILIGRMRYELVGKNGRHFLPETQAAIQGLAEVDRLNVCDTWDEAAHGYTFSSHLGNLVLNGTPRIDSYQLAAGPERVIDAGRAILGYEAFNVRAAPGRDLVVVMRTAPSTEVKLLRPGGLTGGNLAFAEAGLLLTAGGRPIGRFQFRPRAGWDEQVLRVPAAAVSEPSLRLEIRGRYASFYYWFYQ